MTGKPLSDLSICIKGAGEMASGVACRLHAANIKRIVMLEVENPLAVRRRVSFCEAVYEGMQTVEGIDARLVSNQLEIERAWEQEQVAVIVDPRWYSLQQRSFDVAIDAILAKQNLGTGVHDATFVIGLGPGFTAGGDVSAVIETNRGHDLGRVIKEGSAEPDTGIPGEIGSYTSERVLRSPSHGMFSSDRAIGEPVKAGEIIGNVGNKPVVAEIDGIIRGLIRNQTRVKTGYKVGDVDPRGNPGYCTTISEKARAIGGGVLEAILTEFNK